MSEIQKIWKTNLSEAADTITKTMQVPGVLDTLEGLTKNLIQVFSQGGTVFTCGNGGSHCDAMHFAEELTGKYRKDRKPLGALALGDAAHTTCVANDYGFEHVFERQLLGLARKGDMLLLLSTSGKSKNLLLAAKAAKTLGIKTFAFLGRDGGELKNYVDSSLVVPAQTSDRIQEMHIKFLHTAIETVERALFPENYGENR